MKTFLKAFFVKNYIAKNYLPNVYLTPKLRPIELNGDFPNTKATVFFASAGQKQLLLKFAKLQLIKN